MYLIAALLLSLGAMVGIFWYVGAEADYDKEYIGYTGEQQVLSQQLAKNALEASLGRERAFGQLAAYRDRFEETLANERKGNVAIGMLSSRDSVEDELLAVEKNWEGFRKNVDYILKGQATVAVVAEVGRVINSLMPKLQAYDQEVVEILLKAKSSRSAINLATRQLMLSQRIVNNIKLA